LLSHYLPFYNDSPVIAFNWKHSIYNAAMLLFYIPQVILHFLYLSAYEIEDSAIKDGVFLPVCEASMMAIFVIFMVANKNYFSEMTYSIMMFITTHPMN
jgi:hypothetical protein